MMNLLTALKIGARGLTAERTRVNVAAMNLANAEVTRTVDGGPYRAKSVIFRAVPLEEAESEERPFISFQDSLEEEMGKMETVEVEKIVDDPGPFKEVYDPTHPDADKNGIVRYPNVNVMEQMVDLMTAQRAYEADATVIDTVKAMGNKALEIGR